jgi:hypothetical protein
MKPDYSFLSDEAKIIDYVPNKKSDDILILYKGKLYKKFYGRFIRPRWMTPSN